MADLQKLCLPPLFTHSIDYDNNLTIYECYGALLHYLNNVLLKDLNDLKAIIETIIEVNNQQEIKIENNKVNIELNTLAIQNLQDLHNELLNDVNDLKSIIEYIIEFNSEQEIKIEANTTAIQDLKDELLGVNSIVDDIRGDE